MPRLTGFRRQGQRIEFRTDVVSPSVWDMFKLFILQVRRCKVLTTTCWIEVFSRYLGHTVPLQFFMQSAEWFVGTLLLSKNFDKSV